MYFLQIHYGLLRNHEIKRGNNLIIRSSPRNVNPRPSAKKGVVDWYIEESVAERLDLGLFSKNHVCIKNRILSI